jgi:hypothetical protein
MPYKVIKRGGDRPYKIVKDGKIVGSSMTPSKAKASIIHRIEAEQEEAKRRG